MQPCGGPVEVTETSEATSLTSTLCDLLVRKSVTHRISWWSRLRQGESFSFRICGCQMLNAEEKSANSSLAVVLGCSRCSSVSMSVLASLTPLPARYKNWRGSISGSVTVMMCLFMTLSIAPVMRGVRATGLRSFRGVTEPFLLMGTTVVPPQLLSQHRRTLPRMFSGPGAVFSLVLLRALTTSSLLKESSAAAGLSYKMIGSSRVVLSVC